MTEHEAQAELMILRGLASSGNDLALLSDRIDRLYFAVCGKHLRKCRCKDKYRDALLEIYAKLKYNSSKKIKDMAKCRLVAGVVIQWKGSHYTNANITDEIARQFLATFPQRVAWFAELPPAKEKAVEAVDATMPDNSPKMASKDIKAEKQPTTPKKKKAPKKRK